MKKIKNYFQNIMKELKKVKWPSTQEVTKNTLSTIVFCVFFGAFFYLIDIAFSLIVGAFS